MKITLFPALNGDSILVEYVASHYILIDGGYVDTYRTYLLPRLREAAANGSVIDVIVVTHIDGDHISGIIKLLEEDECPIQIGEIWYNGYRHVQSAAKVSDEKEPFVHRNICKEALIESKPISAKQGCTLSMLIIRNKIPWNSPAKGDVIKAQLSFPLRDATVHILSPNNKDIENIESFWKKRLIKDGLLRKAHSEEYWDDAYEFSLSREKPGFHFHEKKISKSYDLKKIIDEPYEPDESASNGSSISFVLESGGKRILFLGDAHAETVEESLSTLYGDNNKPYRFDAVKLSHHGSYNNNSPKLLNMITCDNWLISTNGDKYNHPDMTTLSHIITKDKDCCKKLFFNYKLPICEELIKDVYHEEYKFEVIIPENNEGLIISI